MHNKDNKRKTIILLIIVLLLLIIILLLLKSCSNDKSINKPSFSNNQIDLSQPNQINNTSNDEYFELVGYSELPIDINNQNINLMNIEDNNVYLKYEVYELDTLLFESDLIKPGKMQQYNVYLNLDAGKHNLIYLIDVYDYDLNILWNNIQQQQDIIINK